MIPAEPIIGDAFILKMKADLFDASEIKIQTPSLHVINHFSESNCKDIDILWWFVSIFLKSD